MNTAAVRRLAIPSPDELVERARAMVPAIRALAEETERNRTLLPTIVVVPLGRLAACPEPGLCDA